MSLGGNIFSSIGSDNSEPDYNTEQQKTLLTVKGDSAKIEGKLIISKSIEIDCEIHGELIVDGQITIQQSGYVNADVKTIDATVNGVYEGNMEATGNVQITQSGKVNGNIKTDSLIIEKGGIFSGNVSRITTEDYEKKNNPEPKIASEPEEIIENPIYKSEYKEETPVEESVEVFEEKDEDTLEL
ncbi:MAG: bactofilin family protein [Candidatus Humimicrobiaceae bacterium]